MKSSKFRHTQTHLCMLEDRLNHSSPLVTPGCYANEAVKHHSQRYFSCPCLCRHYFLSTLDCLFFRAFLHLFPFLLTWHTSSSFPIIPFSSSLSYSPLWLFILSFLPLPPSPLLPSFPHALASSFIPACLRALPLLLAPPDYSASLPSASSPPFISHSVLLILLFLPFTPLLLLAIIQFSPVFLSKYCHLALPQSSDWASLRIAYVRSPLYALARSLILLAHVQEAKTLIFTPSGHLVLKKFVTKKTH